MKRTGNIIQIMPCPEGMVAIFKEESGALDSVAVHGLALLDSGEVAPFGIDSDGMTYFPDEATDFVKYDFLAAREPKWLLSANLEKYRPKGGVHTLPAKLPEVVS